jgi:hypothetical protein
MALIPKSTPFRPPLLKSQVFATKRRTYMEWFKKTHFYLDFDTEITQSEKAMFVHYIERLGGVRFDFPC